jgi:hypothetical protein
MKKEVYEKPRPKSLGKPKALSANQKRAAKAFARSRVLLTLPYLLNGWSQSRLRLSQRSRVLLTLP